jgi:hypothetical protein
MNIDKLAKHIVKHFINNSEEFEKEWEEMDDIDHHEFLEDLTDALYDITEGYEEDEDTRT